MYRLTLPDVTVEPNPEGVFGLFIEEEPMISGDIRITAEERADILLEVTLSLPAPDRETAAKMFSHANTSTRERPEATNVSLDFAPELAEYGSMDKARLRIRLTLPLETELQLEAKFLQVNCDGALSGLRITESVAPVTISGMRGRAHVRSAGATVRVTNHLGPLDILCERAQVRLTDVEIPENISTPGIAARIETTDERIILTRYKGPLTVRTSRSDIRGRSVEIRGQGNRIQNEGGRIDIRFEAIHPETEIAIKNTFDDISLRAPEDLDARLILENDPGGTITIDGFMHRVKRAEDNFLEAICAEGSGRFLVSTSGGGQITLSASF
jgi:hypothetical protein